jgi:hypothetical protein
VSRYGRFGRERGILRERFQDHSPAVLHQGRRWYDVSPSSVPMLHDSIWARVAHETETFCLVMNADFFVDVMDIALSKL